MTEPRTLYFTDVRFAQLAMAARQHDIQTLREAGQYDEEPDDPDAAIRAAADANPNFGRANSLLNQGRTLVALDETGRFLTDLQPTRSYLAAYEFSQSHPDAQAASLCGREQDLIACSFSDTGGNG
jgi:hypothetical protein